MKHTDTTIEAAEIQRTIHRRMGPVARLRLALEMSESIRGLAKAGIRHRNPLYSEEEVTAELLSELYSIPRKH